MSDFRYPTTVRDDTSETLHGRRIADPYRWLEDTDADQTADWVMRQNEATENHLDGLPSRHWFQQTMSSIVHRPRAGVPQKHGGKYFVSRNDGQQDQDVWFVADTLAELEAGGRVIIDPNTLSEDGTDSVRNFAVSKDGHYLAYAVSEGGSDWQTFTVLELATGEPVPDAEIQTKFCTPTWLPDNTSYVYPHFPHTGHAAGTQTAALGGAQLKIHRIGEPPDSDLLALEFEDNDRLMFASQVSHDQQWLVVTIVEGTENRNRLWCYPLTTSGGTTSLGQPIKLVDQPIAEFDFIRIDGSTVYLHTDLDAPRGRVLSCDLTSVEPDFTEVIAEQDATALGTLAAADKLIMMLLEDARPVLHRFELGGTDLGTMDITGGSLVDYHGEADEPEAFFGMSSVTSSTEAYVVEAATGRVRQLDLTQPAESSFTPPQITVHRRRANSLDGTEVPYFLIASACTDLTVAQPTLLYGYGGFKIPVLADYRPGWSAWLAAGGVLAIANLRGGGEFGTEWYDQGRGDHKQNVFDDFIGVAEHLIATGVTTSGQLAIHGRSNGGLLVGAAMTQRPDLFAVSLPGVGVLDLLRFHKFTIGAAWISDYGNPDDPDQFETALAYSPLHQVVDGTRYPATLVTTGDHDDRVVPLHSHKFIAALQHAQAGPEPVLTRIEIAGGHGMGKPAAMVAAEWADLLAFAADHTGLSPW